MNKVINTFECSTETDRGKISNGKARAFEDIDEIDSRGTFQKAEVSKELKKMSRLELEGRLGITSNKVLIFSLYKVAVYFVSV